MYATWKGFALVTNEGKEVDEIAYASKEVAVFTLMSSPSFGSKTLANGYWFTGGFNGGINGGGYVNATWGARPAHRFICACMIAWYAEEA